MAFQFPKHLSNFQGVIRIPKRLQRNKAFESDVDRKDQMELKIMLNHDKTFTRIILYMNFFNSSGQSLSNTIFWCWIILYYISIIWVYLSFFLVFYNERVCLFVFGMIFIKTRREGLQYIGEKSLNEAAPNEVCEK